MLAAAIDLTGPSVASACAQPTAAGPISEPAARAPEQTSDSIDWVIGIGAVGRLTAVGSGLAAKRHRARKQQATTVARAP